MHFQLSSSKKKCLNHNTKLPRKYVLATWPNKSGFGAKSEYTVFVYSGKITGDDCSPNHNFIPTLHCHCKETEIYYND